MKRHPEKVLTAVKVRSINKAGRYTDGGGLYLVVCPSGSKRWVLRTTILGQRCDLGLGGLSAVTLAEARKAAVRLRKVARNGGDPRVDRRRAKEERWRETMTPSFEVAARNVHQAIPGRSGTRSMHSSGYRAFRHTPFPSSVRCARGCDRFRQVLNVLSPIWLEIPETARRIRQRMKLVFQWAKAKGYRSGDNPAEDVSRVLPRHSGKREHHAALPYAEVPGFLKALRVADAGVAVKLAFEFMILTAARTSESRLAKWSEINFKEKTWTCPADRMKANVEHKVPLSARCIEILNAAKEIGDTGDFIFPGRSPKQPLSQTAFLMCMRRMDRGDLTGHGFRSSFRDWAEERTACSNNVIEAALAHSVKDKVEAAYLRTKLFEKRRELMKQWSAFATTVNVGKVIAMQAR